MPIYCELGTNSFGQVTNIFKNTRFTLFFKSMLLGDITKVLKPTNKSIWLKFKPLEKLLILSVSYQHIVNKVSII